MNKKGLFLFSVLVLSAPSTVLAEGIQSSDAKQNNEQAAALVGTSQTEMNSSTELPSSEDTKTEQDMDKEDTEKKTLTPEEIDKLRKEAKTPEEYQKVLEYIKETTDYASSVDGMRRSRAKASFFSSGQRQGAAEFMGTSKDRVLNELKSHEWDNFYLGTPFRGLWIPSIQNLSPNGDPNQYGPGFNCTGFVASVFQRSGGNLNAITNVANAWGDVANAYNWRDALRQNTEYYEFSSVQQLLSSGKAEKGDVLYFEPDFSKPNYDCHIGFFWGNKSSDNMMWHSYDRNIKSNIKSATPWTKIMLFKLGGDNKDNTTSQRSMNQVRYVNTGGAAIYSRPYQTGDGASDYTSGLVNAKVTVTKEVVNGHGTWQQFSYTKNGQNRTGWIQSSEFKDILKTERYSDKKVLDKNFAIVYDQPYYPGVRSIVDLKNQRGMQVSISEKGITGYGEWYKVFYDVNGRSQSGWMKSTDFVDTLPSKKIDKDVTIKVPYGLIYNEAYCGESTKVVGNTSGMQGKEIKVTEEQQTGYGLWYKTIFTQNGQQVSGWIKATDTDNYRGYQKIDEDFYVNKDYGLIYESPYTSNQVQSIGNLSGKLNQYFHATAKATTDYGEWYEVSFKNGANQNATGWVKSVDLDKNMTIKKNEFKASFNKDYGIFYDMPYVNNEKTKEVGRLNGRVNSTITITEEAKTPAGLWYHTRLSVAGADKDVWVSANDVARFYNYQSLETKRVINKNYGAVYDRPYDGNQTQSINNLNGMVNRAIDIDASAETSYGTWYRAVINNNNKRTIGWVKSVDLIDEKTNQKALNQKAEVTQEYGLLYNEAYISPRHTKQIGRTKVFYKEKITLLEQVTTAYGTWYRFEGKLSSSDTKQDLWIKSVDIKLIK
ncbi:GW dipeptide domain-containing protein [Vagococcus vulneris]|uniref:GW domain-containing protein n=1 Tax=Vagococcus vulneris TaxID=1977869 RepID=A0A429ZYE2_9ENTE|nr:GW dipeptide domain-containing protein [Vagococcus vulneris]RST98953.1 hypothetical protein CBF37_06175 [Vagococcus vulneris]